MAFSVAKAHNLSCAAFSRPSISATLLVVCRYIAKCHRPTAVVAGGIESLWQLSLYIYSTCAVGGGLNSRPRRGSITWQMTNLAERVSTVTFTQSAVRSGADTYRQARIRNSPQHSAAARKSACCCGVLRTHADPRVVVKVKLRTRYPCSRAVSTGREHGRHGHDPWTQVSQNDTCVHGNGQWTGVVCAELKGWFASHELKWPELVHNCDLQFSSVQFRPVGMMWMCSSQADPVRDGYSQSVRSRSMWLQPRSYLGSV